MKLRIFLALVVPLLGAPSTSRADYIYVSNVDSNSILQFDSSGTGAVFTTNGLNNPTGMAFDQKGNLYVANFGDNTIEKFDASGAATVFASSGLDGPVGMAFDQDGNLYVANQGANISSGSLVEFHSSGGVLTTNVTCLLSGLEYPLGVAWDQPINDVYVAASYTIFDLRGNTIGSFVAAGLACDSAGNLYAADYYFAVILIFDTSGGFVHWLYSEYEVTAMAFDSEGTLYAASAYDNNILKYDQWGDFTAFANSGLSWGIAVRPVTAGPRIALLGANPLTNECHTAFTDPGAIASEGGTDLSSNIVVSGTVDANVPGTYTLTYTVVDAFKSSASATRTVVVVDTTPPVVGHVSVDKAVLWPPNHKLVNVTVNYSATDACSDVNCSLSVTSNEPLSDTDGGDAEPEWVIVDAHHVLLRAERAGSGNGRDYTIRVTCTDSSGNISTEAVDVTVPKSQSK
jgi:hypothetical protein